MSGPQITHVVLVQWKPEVDAAEVARLERLVDELGEAVPGIMSVRRGASVSPEQLEAGFEWGLVIDFADADARDGYLPHPAHQPVAHAIGEGAERLVVFDVA